MYTQESDNGEPDDFARTDLQTGQPAPERLARRNDRALLGGLRAQVTLPRAVVAAIVTLILAALVTTQLGYMQRLIDSVRYRILMIGVPELTETKIAPQPAAHLTTANWEKIPLPAPANQINAFSADPTDSQSVLVCGLSSLKKSPIQGEMTPRGPVWLWLTHDAGKTWGRSQWPPITGSYCWINRAPDDPQRLTFLIEHPSPIKPRCSEYDMLLSDDGGATLRPTPAPYVATEDAVRYCSHGAFIVRGRLFFYTNWSTGQAESDSHTSLAYSDDDGRHWSEISDDAAQFLHTRLTTLADGTLLTVRWPPQEEDQENQQNQGTLWASPDRGASWRPLSKLQGIVPIEALTPFGATSANAATEHPLYFSAGSFILSRMLRLKAAEIVDNRHWAYLLPLPVNGTSADHIGITNILGVTASGKLLAFGVNPQTGIQTDKPPEEQFDQQWLWSWDPHMQRWTSLAPPLPVAWKWCADGCWRASLAQSATSQQTILWVRGYVSENGENALYRLTLPPEIV
jgi:hypothetical protein